jgi:hypothetical protein
MRLKSVIDKVYERKLFEHLLLEANVANVRQPIGADGSIFSYLKQYASGLDSPELQNAFIKKITTFLINDPRTLHALREVPPDAPDWAKAAVAQGQLMVFIPDQRLNDEMQHIVHYLAAAEEDSKQTTNNDQRVFAQRELTGFLKAANLNLLVTKSNEYFSRGTRNIKRQAVGMKPVFVAGGGFAWYELETAEAFQREGKILQNCIGSHYTPAKCARDGTIIFVMRDNGDNSVVAARIKRMNSGRYELMEVKGKQNRPPVNQYMEPTIKFLNKMHFLVSSTAKYDLSNAGYFYIDGEFYDLPTAIKKFLHTQKIGDLPSGGEVVRVTGNSDIMSKAYPNNYDSVIYETRTSNGDPEFAFYVKNFVLNKVKSCMNQTFDEDGEEIQTGTINPERRNEAYELLASRDLLSDVSNDMRKEFFWNEKLRYDQKTKKFQSVKPDKQHKRPEDEHAWDQYSSPELIDEIRKIVIEDTRPSEELHLEKNDIKNVYLMHASKGIKVVFIETKQGVVIPGIIKTGRFTTSVDSFGFNNEYAKTQRFDKEVKSVVSFANDNGLKIPKSICELHGIISTPSGYVVYQLEPKQIMQDPPVTLYSFENLKGDNKDIAISYVTDHFDLKQDTGGTKYYGNPIFRTNKYEPIDNEAKNLTSILKVDITYGGGSKIQKVALGVSGKNIVVMDVSSKGQKWQSWDDYDKVAATINYVKDKLGLTFSPSATKDAVEFKIINGNLSTKSNEIKQRLEKKSGKQSNEGVDALPFDDGSDLEKMTPAEQADWMRKGLSVSGLKGEAWKLVKPNKTVAYVYVVNNGKITGIYRAHPNINQSLPTIKGFNQESLKYLKGASDVFGWKPGMASLEIKPTEKDSAYDGLVRIERNNNAGKLYGIHDINKEPSIQRLVRFGLVKRVYRPDEEDEFTHTYWAQLTKDGEEALRQLRKGHSFNGLTHIPTKEVDPQFELPKKEQPIKKVAAEPQKPPSEIQRQGGPAGARTKASMAIDKFREMQQANGGRIPTLSEFRDVLTQPPFNMSPLAAQTYYYATKKRVAGPIGENYEIDFSDIDMPLWQSIFEDVKVMRI